MTNHDNTYLRAVLGVLLMLSVSACMRLGSPAAHPGGQTGTRVNKRAFLVRGQAEDAGYGVYSYVLFGTPPADQSQASRYLSLIQAYLAISQLPASPQYVQPWQIALTYLPVTTPPPFDTSGASPGYVPDSNGTARAAQWLLDHYDYDRAQKILLVLRSDQFTGPYLVTHAKPLTAMAVPPEQFVFHDMSSVESSVIGLWMRTFLEQSAQERFWERYELRAWAFDLRNAIATAAAIAPQLRNAFEQLIVFVDLGSQPVASR